MWVAQVQEQSLRSRSRSRALSRLSPGLTTSTTTTTSARTRAAVVLLPSAALMLTLSCLFSPVPVQAMTGTVSVSIGVDAAALPLSSTEGGNIFLAERTTTTTVHGLGCASHSQFLASLVEPKAKVDAATLGQEKQGVMRVSSGSMFVNDKQAVLYRNGKGSGIDDGRSEETPAGCIATGHGDPFIATSIQHPDDQDYEQYQQQHCHQQQQQPHIEGFNDHQMSKSKDLIGRKPRPSRSTSNSSVGGEALRVKSPLFSLPPLSWIRTHLGTKTPYPHENRPVGPLEDTPEGYELVQLHLICRHGTRYPSASKSVGFKNLADKLKGVKLPGFEWIKDWPSDALYPPARGNLLSLQGDVDLYQIGRRFAIRYKTLLDKYPYDANTYKFTTSAKSRCSQSAYGFSVGFFEGRLATNSESDPGQRVIGDRPVVQPVDISMLPIGLDKELAVKYACPRWLENVKDQPGVVLENRQFESKFVPALADRLSAVLSADAETPAAMFNITVKDVGVIHNMCGFEVAMHNNDQTWCRLLGLGLATSSKEGDHNEDEVKDSDVKDVFWKYEIAGDLDDYYTHGPGVPFNRHLGCKLGTSLMEAVETALSEDKIGGGVSVPKDTSPGALGSDDDEGEAGVSRALLKFGHSETILFFSSFLGLYNQKGIPLTADMTPEQYAEREFRTSKFSPFAANMAFEVYRPTAAETSPRTRKARRRLEAEAAANPEDSNTKPTPRGLIRLLVNEEPFILPGCGSDYFCDWSTFKKVLQLAGTGCDFDSCCSTLTKPTPTPAPASEVKGEAKAKAKAVFLAVVQGFRHQVVFERNEEPQQPVCLAVDPVVK
ncbi:PHOsphatase [Linnemannia schmuckeri]|uniref:Multiple inositol polyphosphate phosphatase 1 n=1 Tax=Linnemannia schmuckeri TaxID=64567 RepID=A0A9P5S6U7_9FUNG|nr:PHOsphatase [Linnemannia schmuckeri]